MRLWVVGNEDARRILGDPSERTFYAWKAGKVAKLPGRHGPTDRLRRGNLQGLQILYSEPGQADAWVHKPNRHFGDRTPLSRMAAGDVTDLAAVRAYLDAARAPWS
jgi:hypothetical protein